MKTSFNLLFCNSYFLYLITYTITFPICNTPFSFVICLNPTLNETLTMNVRSVFYLIFGLINQIGTKLHYFCKLVAVKLNLIIIKKITGMIHVLCNAKWLRRWWWGVIACYRPLAAWLATDGCRLNYDIGLNIQPDSCRYLITYRWLWNCHQMFVTHTIQACNEFVFWKWWYSARRR